MSTGAHEVESETHTNFTSGPTHEDIDTLRQSIKAISGSHILEGELPAGQAREENEDQGSYYWDASTMAPLNAASVAAIERLRAYRPPSFPTWDRLPINRRAAVLILLFADRRGDLRVVITMRAASLRSFSGHAAFPGGKADSLDESPYQIARREAWEEIGLPLSDAAIPAPFHIEPLCELPHSLAKTELAVRPCIALLHSSPFPPSSTSASPVTASNDDTTVTTDGPRSTLELPPPDAPTADESLIPRLDAREVAAVFSAPFHNFLCRTDERSPLVAGTTHEVPGGLPPGEWYEGAWSNWHDSPWRIHYFHVPVVGQRIAKPRRRSSEMQQHGQGHEHERQQHALGPTGQSALAEQPEEEAEAEEAARYLVWGMTARMLVDAARLAYGEEPEFEHSDHFGDEAMIERLENMGRLGEKRKL